MSNYPAFGNPHICHVNLIIYQEDSAYWVLLYNGHVCTNISEKLNIILASGDFYQGILAGFENKFPLF